FSSRRRHTRFSRDWSPDVCSSDLDTILRVAQAIVDRQRNFFSHGEVAMRPLVLREIADTLGLHESTISRVTTQKYMLTPHGMFRSEEHTSELQSRENLVCRRLLDR